MQGVAHFEVEMGVEHSIELWYDPSFAARKWTVRCSCGFVACCETEQAAIHARDGHEERVSDGLVRNSRKDVP
jgi:hypothetical protein